LVDSFDIRYLLSAIIGNLAAGAEQQQQQQRIVSYLRFVGSFVEV
jgi:hypothetical protein